MGVAQFVAAAVDSFLFLVLAFGWGGLAFFDGQMVGKLAVLAIAFPVVYGWRRVAL